MPFPWIHTPAHLRGPATPHAFQACNFLRRNIANTSKWSNRRSWSLRAISKALSTKSWTRRIGDSDGAKSKHSYITIGQRLHSSLATISSLSWQVKRIRCSIWYWRCMQEKMKMRYSRILICYIANIQEKLNSIYLSCVHTFFISVDRKKKVANNLMRWLQKCTSLHLVSPAPQAAPEWAKRRAIAPRYPTRPTLRSKRWTNPSLQVHVKLTPHLRTSKNKLAAMLSKNGFSKSHAKASNLLIWCSGASCHRWTMLNRFRWVSTRTRRSGMSWGSSYRHMILMITRWSTRRMSSSSHS